MRLLRMLTKRKKTLYFIIFFIIRDMCCNIIGVDVALHSSIKILEKNWVRGPRGVVTIFIFIFFSLF